MQLNNLANALLDEQLVDWAMAKENYAALENVVVKDCEVDGYEFKVQFNPRRIVSSAAKVDAKSIEERPCFLCLNHLPKEQRGIAFKGASGMEYTVLVNPFPIFKRHLTIPSNIHTPQTIAGRVGDMLKLAGELTDFLVFYNGPKCGASAPDHFHFQAGNKGFLPLEVKIDNLIENNATKLSQNRFILNNYPVKALVYRSKDSAEIEQWFENEFLVKFNNFTKEGETEPMMNLMAWKTEGTYYFVVFARKLHRPWQFFEQGEKNILISPASIDLGGVFITPLEKDFEKISYADIRDILQQVSVDDQTFNSLTK